MNGSYPHGRGRLVRRPPSAVGCPRYFTYWKFFRGRNYFLITFHFSTRLNGRLSCQNHLIWQNSFFFNNFRNRSLRNSPFKVEKCGNYSVSWQWVHNFRELSTCSFWMRNGASFSIGCIQILSPPCVVWMVAPAVILPWNEFVENIRE